MASNITLSASVRQNLLSLQSTAELLATTQSRLATGKKVNTALDNPTNFFTAASLDNRANDINNLLDGIGNGVQVLQAANTGITSLQKLVDTAKSIAQQVLQAPVGYSTKNSVTSGANAGGTAANLLGATLATGDVLTIAATGGGTASSITFGAGASQVDTLTELNAALAANNLQASVNDTTGAITITTTNDAASADVGALGGTATGAGKAFLAGSVTTVAKVADATSQTTRANLVAQYNNIIAQITTTAQDASFNGTNLLNGDNLKLTFNETGKSTLNISGVTFNATGLGLASLVGGTDFLDNGSANKVITSLGSASSALRSQASALGSNLSIVQIRQDFSKNLINVLQTGSSNLTLADTNQEAANSQALSTRQSIAVSALALANQSQQSVLQLLR
ncbi:MAG: flagellin [Bradyrhizobium sp.]|uniref:flagellin N-terminal helical domain-containing protein n=1 Tax=Bradyrhizobium sp. TaxID=376 RepID=UPI0027321CD6|nr:flagellin [Bradyrhizobium sp.]MDP1867974.1 flagellin [Bradyrhizobium sp.]